MVVLGLAESMLPALDRLAGPVVGLRVGCRSASPSAPLIFREAGGGVDEDDVDVQVQQVRDRVQDPRRDLAQRVQQEIDCRVNGVVAESGAVGDRDPLGHPPCGDQLVPGASARRATSADSTAPGRAAVEPPTCCDQAQRSPAAESLLQLFQHRTPC